MSDKIDMDLFRKPKQTTFAELHDLAKAYIESVKEGFSDALELYSKLRTFEVFSETVKKGIEEDAINELHRNFEGGAKEVFYGLHSISIMPTGTKYDYSEDPIWCNIQGSIQQIESEILAPMKERLKEREAFLKSLERMPATEEDIDETTGETFIPRPPKKIGGKDTLRFSVIKK